MTKGTLIAKGYRANEYLEFVYTDICRPFNVQERESYEYFITLADDYFEFGYVYLMHRKFDALDKFIEFKVE